MSWRDWPAWLKGGVIGAVLSLITSIIYVLFVNLGFGVPLFILFEIPIRIVSFIFNWGQVIQGWRVYLGIFIFNPVFYFIIGALIGFIINKINKRSKK